MPQQAGHGEIDGTGRKDQSQEFRRCRPGTRAWRRLGHALVSADSYGLVLLLVMATYVVSVSMTEAQAVDRQPYLQAGGQPLEDRRVAVT
jgi:hypothetical protein